MENHIETTSTINAGSHIRRTGSLLAAAALGGLLTIGLVGWTPADSVNMADTPPSPNAATSVDLQELNRVGAFRDLSRNGGYWKVETNRTAVLRDLAMARDASEPSAEVRRMRTLRDLLTQE